MKITSNNITQNQAQNPQRKEQQTLITRTSYE